MLARETKIYKDAFNLTKTMFEITRSFRTEYRSTIARRLEDGSAELASKIVEANLCEPKSDERQRVLGHDFVVVYEKLFFFLAIASDLKLISFKQHANISRILDEIGKQATGWRKSTAKK